MKKIAGIGGCGTGKRVGNPLALDWEIPESKEHTNGSEFAATMSGK